MTAEAPRRGTVEDAPPPAGEDAPLRVVEMGSGRPLLLLHGFTGSVEAWGDDLLDRLADGGRVLAVDLPGHGRSPDPGSPAGYAIERVVDRLAGVLDRHGIGRAVWIGYSMGGRVALAAAALRPARVEALVLEGASDGLPTEEERRERRRSDEALARRIETEGIEAFVEDWTRLPLFESRRRLPASVLERERRRRLENRPEALATCLRGLGTGVQPSFRDDLRRIEAPTLLLTGEEDRKFTDLAREMAARLPRARHVRVPGAGHTVHLERPGPWLRAVDGFLRDLPEGDQEDSGRDARRGHA